jgi:molybdopterin-guanine dinucleotide biosynthesis protein MobB
MRAFNVLGASKLRHRDFVRDLIVALRLDGWSVSTLKRAPDGFDLDRPGKASYARREAGCNEVMLVADRRLVLMQEFGEAAPPVESLLARLQPVDIVLLEGFRGASLPTVEVWVPAAGREPRWLHDPSVFAIVAEGPPDAPLPHFAPDDVAALATCVGECLGLRQR